MALEIDKLVGMGIFLLVILISVGLIFLVAIPALGGTEKQKKLEFACTYYIAKYKCNVPECDKEYDATKCKEKLDLATIDTKMSDVTLFTNLCYDLKLDPKACHAKCCVVRV